MKGINVGENAVILNGENTFCNEDECLDGAPAKSDSDSNSNKVIRPFVNHSKSKPSVLCAEHSISNYYIKGFLRGAVKEGYDPQAILVKAGIPKSAYVNVKARIDGEQLQRLILTIRNIMNDHYLGFLKVPGKLAMDLHSACAAIQGETLGQAIRLLTDFINAVRSDEERELIVGDGSDEAKLTFQFSGLKTGVDSHLLYLFRMYWAYRFYCWLVGRQLKLTHVSFTASRPAQSLDYSQCFGWEVLFDQPMDFFCFDQDHLVLPRVRSMATLLDGDYPGNFPDWFTVPGHDQSIANQVEQILIELRDDGMFTPSIDLVASIMVMGRRTLSRKLSKEKNSFQRIKTKVRRDLAKKYLLNSDISISGISAKVGFAEPCDFTRAFVRWEGITPTSFREAVQNSDLR